MTTESLAWFKSSYSSNGGSCVEVAADLVASHEMVPVRDSKDQAEKPPALTPAMKAAKDEAGSARTGPA